MPELIMERPKMSLQMHDTLKKYILRERRKKMEEDVANEQKMMEEMRKVEMNTQTLEQNEQQLKQLETKLEGLQLKKRELFNQLKKVLNEETNLKKNNRPVMPLGNQPLQYGTEANIQMLYSQPGNVTPNAQSILGQSNIINTISQSPTILPISSGSSTPTSSSSNSSSGIASTTLIQSSPLPGNSNNKPQSPFPTPSQHLPHHLASNFPLVPPIALKYFPSNSNGIPPSISPQLIPTQQAVAAAVAALNAAQQSASVSQMNQSPSSSPASNLISSSPRHSLIPAAPSLLSTPSSKRIRSPSPSSSPIHGIHHSPHPSQFIYSQNGLIPSLARSPSLSMIPSSSPPPHLQSNQMYNSPTNNKKSRSSSLMVSIPNTNPALNTNQSPQHQSNHSRQTSGFNVPNNIPPQQQSAFSPFHNGLISNRGMNAFQQQQPQQQTNSNNPMQSYSPLQLPQSNFGISRNMPAPPLPPTSQSPNLRQFPPFNYLNALAQETAQKIILQQQQNQQHIQQQIIQQQFIAAIQQQHLNQLPIHQQHNSSNLSNSSPVNSNSGSSGGGSILTGFSVRPSNQQQPPSSY